MSPSRTRIHIRIGFYRVHTVYTRWPIRNLVTVGLQCSPTGPRPDPTFLYFSWTFHLTYGFPRTCGTWGMWPNAHPMWRGNLSSIGTLIRAKSGPNLGPDLGECIGRPRDPTLRCFGRLGEVLYSL